jgi:hypothetical protein
MAFWGSNLPILGCAVGSLWTPSGDLKIRPEFNIVTLGTPANFEVPTESPKCPTDPGTAFGRGDPGAPPPWRFGVQTRITVASRAQLFCKLNQ